MGLITLNNILGCIHAPLQLVIMHEHAIRNSTIDIIIMLELKIDIPSLFINYKSILIPAALPSTLTVSASHLEPRGRKRLHWRCTAAPRVARKKNAVKPPPQYQKRTARNSINVPHRRSTADMLHLVRQQPSSFTGISPPIGHSFLAHLSRAELAALQRLASITWQTGSHDLVLETLRGR